MSRPSLNPLARLALLASLALAAGPACVVIGPDGGGDDGVDPDPASDTIDREQANHAYSSTSAALVGSQQAAAEVVIDGDGERITVSAPCSGGGTTSVDGQFGDASDFTLDVAFDACAEGGLVIDGSVEYAARIDEDGVALTILGALSYAGEFEASCAIDVAITAGQGGSAVTGTICGQDVTVSATPGI